MLTNIVYKAISWEGSAAVLYKGIWKVKKYRMTEKFGNAGKKPKRPKVRSFGSKEGKEMREPRP